MATSQFIDMLSDKSYLAKLFSVVRNLVGLRYGLPFTYIELFLNRGPSDHLISPTSEGAITISQQFDCSLSSKPRQRDREADVQPGQTSRQTTYKDINKTQHPTFQVNHNEHTFSVSLKM